MNSRFFSRYHYLLVLLAGLLLGACSGRQSPADTAAVLSAGPAADLYTCPMHPEIVRHEPGKCPVCGMFLVKKTVSGPTSDTAAIADAEAPTNPAPSQTQLVHPTRQTVAAAVTAPGVISYDPRRVQNVAARFGGRIEQLYVHYQYQPVRAGQKLYDIYSPELVTEQQNLLFLLASGAEDQPLLRASRRKLRLLGLTAAQLRAIERSRKPQLRLSVYSPASGYLLAPSGTTITPAVLEQTAPFPVREGDYVTTGQTLFQVVNTRQVWALLQLYPADVAAVQAGQPVEISLNEQPQAAPLHSTIAKLEPVIDNAASTVTARVYLPNPSGKLQIGQLVTGHIHPPTVSGLWVPASAVVDLGTRQVVFRQTADNRLQAVAVVVGPRRAGQVQIVRGLTPNDLIAQNAQYLTDSEELIEPIAAGP